MSSHLYRVCVAFEVESGHMLSKHPGKCKFPHGHTRRIEIVLSSPSLDANDMVCDFKAVKLAVGDYINSFDHSLAMNSDDPLLPKLSSVSERIVLFEKTDPTTEVLAKGIYDYVAARIREGATLPDAAGLRYSLPTSLCVERVRVGETSSTWAEYGL